MINFGDWQNMPDYREGWRDKNKNAFGSMLRAADPMTYVPGLGAPANMAHDIGGEFVTGANRVLSPIVKGTNQVLEATTPGVKQLHEAVPMLGNINRFVEDKPFDAAALMAATFFTGGAAANALGSAAAAAPAASGGAGAMGGMASAGTTGTAAITPALSVTAAGTGAGAGAGAAGSTTGALIPASAISPAMASGAYGGISGAAGTGTLGTAGTAAATSALTPSFMTMGGAGYGAIEKARSFMGKAQDAQRYQKSFSNVVEPDTDKLNANRQANGLAQKILDSNSVPTTNIKRIADRISMNRWGQR
jgi:hypothetical protein